MVKKVEVIKSNYCVFTCFAFVDFIGTPAPFSVDLTLSPRRNGLARLVVVVVFE